MARETRYARRDESSIAWASAGAGPLDLLFLPGFVSHVEHAWEDPGLAAFFERLAGFTRLILMDRRGTGLSDSRVGELGLDEEVGDVLAVLDAAGSERAVLLGYTTGGALAVRAAATAPERARALVLYATLVTSIATDVPHRRALAHARARAADRALRRHRRLDGPRGAPGRRALARAPGRPRRGGAPGGRPLRGSRGEGDRRRLPRRLRRAPSRAVRCAAALVEAVRPLGLELRIGLHTGECEAMGDDIGGMAVHTAARVAALAAPGEAIASGTVYGTVVGSGPRFSDLGMHELKGVPGHWPLYAMRS